MLNTLSAAGRCAVLVAAFVGWLAWAPAVHAEEVPAAQCGDVIIVGVRGSGEESYRHNMGPTVYTAAAAFARHVQTAGESHSYVGVQYEAAGVFETLIPNAGTLARMALHALNPGKLWGVYRKRHVDKYLASIEDGIGKTMQTVRSTAGRCEFSDLILTGYSQGAMAVHQAQLRMHDAGDEALDAVVGTLLIADGDRIANSAARSFGAASGEGIRPYLSGLLDLRLYARRDVYDPELTANICIAGDLVCGFESAMSLRNLRNVKKVIADFKRRGGTHLIYDRGKAAHLNDAVDWLAAELGFVGDDTGDFRHAHQRH